MVFLHFFSLFALFQNQVSARALNTAPPPTVSIPATPRAIHGTLFLARSTIRLHQTPAKLGKHISITFSRFLSIGKTETPSFTQFYLVLPDFTEFYRTLPSFTEFYRVLPSFTEFYRTLPDFTEFYRVLPSIFSFVSSSSGERAVTKFYRVLPSFTEFFWVSSLPLTADKALF